MRRSTFRFARSIASMILILPLVGPVTSFAQETEGRTVTVTGEGVVRVDPDIAHLRFGVVTTADDPEEARSLNAEASRNAINAVRELGIDERDIRLEILRLQPRREYDPETRQWIDEGFEAARTVSVRIHNLENLPVVVARVVQQGANRLEQVSYDLENRDQARNDALTQAVEKAREKAQLLASALGEELGRVLRAEEQSFDFPRPMFQLEAMEVAASRDAAAPEPEAYAPGQIEVRVTVSTRFELR